MSDSTFTITNIGSLGGGFLSVPMINYPEVAAGAGTPASS